MKAEIVAEMITNEVYNNGGPNTIKSLSPMVLCFGDMGNHKGFSMHTNQWRGGDISVLKNRIQEHVSYAWR